MGLFEEIGGTEMLRKINKIFYNKMYAHPWIGQFFKDISQEQIESQQVDFMTQALGGPSVYSGRFVIEAHIHMMISEELFELREELLQEAFHEAGASPALMDKWNHIDAAFKKPIVKNSRADCKQRYTTEPILDFENPSSKKKVA